MHLKKSFLHGLRKGAQTHEVWAQSIVFHLSPSISKKRWGFQDKSTHSSISVTAVVVLQNSSLLWRIWKWSFYMHA